VARRRKDSEMLNSPTGAASRHRKIAHRDSDKVRRTLGRDTAAEPYTGVTTPGRCRRRTLTIRRRADGSDHAKIHSACCRFGAADVRTGHREATAFRKNVSQLALDSWVWFRCEPELLVVLTTATRGELDARS